MGKEGISTTACAFYHNSVLVKVYREVENTESLSLKMIILPSLFVKALGTRMHTSMWRPHQWMDFYGKGTTSDNLLSLRSV